jgi:KaiC/GvpD/RAD55 family RecA-like ATPase
MSEADLAVRASYAMHLIPPTIEHDTRAKIGMAAKDGRVEFEDYDDWQKRNPNYDSQEVRAMWNSFKPGAVGVATLFHIAKDYGYRADGDRPAPRPAPAPRKPPEPVRKPAPGQSPSEVWERCQPAIGAHPYIQAKRAAGVPLDTLRVLPADDVLRIGGAPMAGALVVPAFGAGGELQSLQLIPPAGKKMNLPGAPMAGASFTVGDVVPGGPLAVCEGIGTAWACWQATGHPAVVAFGAGNMARVATDLRSKDPTARLVLVPDVGQGTHPPPQAGLQSRALASLPDGEAPNFDANDLAQRDGYDVLAALLESATEPAPPPLPLSVAFADELPDTFTPPDELVEGLLTAGDGSVLYGDSNSGKTFFVIDLACAVARGIAWMGRNTEPGLVVYLAAESPQSVRSRLQAYQRHHGVRVPNFAIVQSPIDLFDGDADTEAVIEVVRQLERQRGQKVRLIVGDTLARLSAGANENAGQDMGLVVRRFDRIRSACNAHFLVIHHSGKNAANGARGWSGIRAAVDTEIEVTDSPQGRCAEITKQRDLSTKGERIGFRLDTVTLGVTKWGAAATSCVLVAADAPDKPKGKRMGEVEGAVVEFLAAHKVGIKKAEVVKHFDGRYDRANVYRAVRALVSAAAIHEAAGMVCISGAAK